MFKCEISMISFSMDVSVDFTLRKQLIIEISIKYLTIEGIFGVYEMMMIQMDGHRLSESRLQIHTVRGSEGYIVFSC